MARPGRPGLPGGSGVDQGSKGRGAVWKYGNVQASGSSILPHLHTSRLSVTRLPMFLIKSGAICEVVEGREREFVSPFAEEIFGQDSRSWQMDAWKYKEDETEPEKGLVPRSMLWGGRGKLNQPVRVKASH